MNLFLGNYAPRTGPDTPNPRDGTIRRFHNRRGARRRRLGQLSISSHEWTDAFGGRRARARAEHRRATP